MRFFTLIICIGLLASCRSSKKITTAIAKKDTIQSVAFDSTAKRDSILFIQNTLRDLTNNTINYQTFTAKINIDYSDA
ncbi:MAG TPA: hypothetical protein VGD26_10555, partial [Chitinophagaceae bacterium]